MSLFLIAVAPPPARPGDGVATFETVLVSVDLNGARVEDGLFLLRESSGRLLVRVDDVEGWRLRLPDIDPILADNEPYLALDSIPGLVMALDEARLHLDLRVPGGGFLTTVKSGRPRDRESGQVEPRTSAAAFLNYAVDVEGWTGRGPSYRGTFEFHLHPPAGLGRLRALLRLEPSGDVARRGIFWSRDLVRRRERLTIGENHAGASALGRSVVFLGMRWSRRFEIDPFLVRTPQLAFQGVLEEPSSVEIRFEDRTLFHERLPPGPFDIRDVDPAARSGEAQLVITGPDGAERIVPRFFFKSPRLLEPGLLHFDHAVGFERLGGGRSPKFDPRPFVLTTLRRGLGERLTGEVRAELRQGLGMLELGASRSFPRLRSAVSASLAEGRHRAGAGRRFGLGYELRRRRFRLSWSAEWTSELFRRLGEESESQLAFRDLLRCDFDLGRHGHLGLSLERRRWREADSERTFGASYSRSLGPGQISAAASADLGRSTALGVRASFSTRLGRNTLRWSGAKSSGREFETQAEIRRRPRGRELGWSYRLRGERTTAKAVARRKAPSHEARFEIEGRGEELAWSSRVEGSLVLLGGSLHAARTIGRAFALVEVPGFEGVEVLYENRRAGRTDARGRLLLPGLVPYQANRVRIDPTGLPVAARVDVLEQVVIPRGSGGVKVSFAAISTRHVRFRAVDAAGEALPPQTLLRTSDGSIEALVARDGLVFLSAVPVGKVNLTARFGRRGCRLEVEVPEKVESLEHLGEVTCR